MTEYTSSSAKRVIDIREGKANPFWTTEALNENLGAIRGALREAKITEETHWQVFYHLKALDDYADDLFNAFAALLPEIYKASDGNLPLEKLRENLTQLAEKHQQEWDKFINYPRMK